MPITGRTPNECFEKFTKHVAALVDKIVPTTCPMLCLGRGDVRTLSFKNQPSDAVPLDTAQHGKVYLYLAQTVCTVPHKVPQEGKHRLRTARYEYKLYGERPEMLDDAVLRWEYATKARVHNDYCRHHFQTGKSAPKLSLSASTIDLSRMHMPTGWVLMEEVFRFLIHELGMKPPCGEEWPAILSDSERAFHEEFTLRGSLPPGPL